MFPGEINYFSFVNPTVSNRATTPQCCWFQYSPCITTTQLCPVLARAWRLFPREQPVHTQTPLGPPEPDVRCIACQSCSCLAKHSVVLRYQALPVSEAGRIAVLHTRLLILQILVYISPVSTIAGHYWIVRYTAVSAYHNNYREKEDFPEED